MLCVSGSSRSGLPHKGRRPRNQGDSKAAKSSVLTDESHSPTGRQPKVQGQPTVRCSPDKALARQAGVSEAGSGPAKSTATVLGIPMVLLRQGPGLLA